MIRSLRHRPPGRAGTGNRSRIFDAALEQAEQLFKAAESVGIQSRPLLVFYGLSQAARAINAAAVTVSNNDAKLSGHGITVPDLEAAANHPLSSLVVVPQNSGAFVQVAALLRSSSLAGKPCLGEVWGVLPGVELFPLPGSVACGALHVIEKEIPGSRLCVELRPLPSELMHVATPEQIRGVEVSMDDWENERARIITYLERYPSLGPFEFLDPNGPARLYSGGGGTSRVAICWELGPGVDREDALNHRTVVYRGNRLALPSLGPELLPVHPLISWWAILFTLSMLARYEPSAWSSCISVGRSADAVPIEVLLEDALDALPETIYDAIVAVSRS